MPEKYYNTDLSGSNFLNVDLSGQSLAHSDITDCQFGNCQGANFNCCKGERVNFQGANISDTFFEQATYSVISCLRGAFWHDVEITHVSEWITSSGLYWCFATNAFVQIGCMQKTLEAWKAIGQDLESLAVLHVEQPKINLEATLTWWNENSPTIIAICQSFNSM